jgi:methylthioribulose-1-phosphate dehydratase
VDFAGRAVGSDKRPSAETVLHTQLYERLPEVGCVLHTHSLSQTLASRLYAGAGHIRFEDYELIKAFPGQETHDAAFDLCVLPNNQHIPTLAAQVDVLLDKGPMWGYLIDGHGLYAWGRDVFEARRHLEAFEFLISCELEMRKLRP